MFFLPATAVYLAMLFYTIPIVEGYANGLRIFDLSPGGYSYDHTIELLGSLGESGRHAYLYRQLPLDFVYPGLFAISCSLLLSWLLLKNRPADSPFFYFCLIPVIAGCFDYIENIFIVRLIVDFPDVSGWLVKFSSCATVIKSLATTLFFVVLIFSVTMLFLNRLKQRSRR